jgi:hypothetical protein
MRAEMTEDEFSQEMLCSFSAALRGAYYAKILEKLDADGRITKVPYDPALPVFTAWDLGIDDSTAIWFIQFYKNEIRVIDYVEDSGYGLQHYVKILREKEYVYEEHYFPHDINVRELGTGVSRIETLRSLGLTNVKAARKLKIEDGINAVRMLLPRCYFDANKCEKGLKALRSYQREWDAMRQIWKEKPTHDKSSHGADSFRTLATLIKELGRRDRHKDLPRSSNYKYNVVD